MMRALFEFYAPARTLGRCVFASAAATLLFWAIDLPSPFWPSFACLGAWSATGCWGELVVQGYRDRDRTWPVPERTLHCARVLAPWSLGWATIAASQVVTGALVALGEVSAADWSVTLGHVSWLFGLTPLASVLSYRLVPRVQLLAGLTFAALMAGLGLILPIALPWAAGFAPRSWAGAASPGPRGAAALLLLAALLARAWVTVAPKSAPHADRSRAADPARPRANSLLVARTFFFLLLNPKLVWLLPIVTVFFLAWGVRHGTVSLMSWAVGSGCLLHMYSGLSAGAPLPPHLPVSRNRLFFWSLAPLCGLAVGALVIEAYAGLQSPARVVDSTIAAAPAAATDREHSQKPEPRHRRLLVPSLYWSATLGEPPYGKSASGEVARIASHRLFPGLPLSFYNPFDVWQWEDPATFNARASQTLREQWHLDVSADDLEQALVRQHQPATAVCANGRGEPQQGALQATCDFPWTWIAIKMWLFALFTGVYVWWQLRARETGRWRRYLLRPALFVAFALGFLLLDFAADAVRSYEPQEDEIFGGAVLLGELARLLLRAPAIVGSLGLCLLLALYWHLLRLYRRAEPWSLEKASLFR